MSALCQKQTLRVDNTRGGAAPIVEPDDKARSYNAFGPSTFRRSGPCRFDGGYSQDNRGSGGVAARASGAFQVLRGVT
jgi:hypothetical protein